MNDRTIWSDELINAFVDGELAPDDKARIYQAMQDDPALRERVAELRSVRDLVHTAYATVSAEQRPVRSTRRRMQWAIAASLLVGFSLGWFGYSALHTARSAPLAGIAHGTPLRIVFHITRDDPAALEYALDESERMLNGADGDGRPVREIRIVANGPGINLFRTTIPASMRERLHSLFVRYPNLAYNVCAQTRRRMMQEEAAEIPILPWAKIVDSGTAEALRLQERGWSYIPI